MSEANSSADDLFAHIDTQEPTKRRAKGSGTVYQLKNGRWEAAYTEHTLGRKRHRFYGKTEQQVLSQLNAALNSSGESVKTPGAVNPSRSRRSSGHVYFIQGIEGGPIKIGIAGNVESRLKAIQACSPVLLRILYVAYNGGRELEERLHLYFSDLRLHGEWFEDGEGLVRAIEQAVERRGVKDY